MTTDRDENGAADADQARAATPIARRLRSRDQEQRQERGSC